MDQLKTQSAQEAKLHFLDYWRIIRIRKTVILAVFLLVVITSTLVTFILTEKYSSKARIKIERDAPDIAGLVSQQMPMAYDPYFIQTEFEVIQSELILDRVIQDLGLRQKWGKKFAGDRSPVDVGDDDAASEQHGSPAHTEYEFDRNQCLE